MTTLRFPFNTIPEFGTVKPVAPGVFWLRMPLPLALDHINLYLLEDGDSWVIVDTGIRSSDIQTHWQEIFDGELNIDSVSRVVVTHMHPDHVGQAGWLCDKFAAPLHMTRAEFYAARVMCSIPEGLSWTAEQYMRRNGNTEQRIESVRNSKFRMSQMVESLPMAYTRMRGGDVLSIGGREWQVMIGEGHSPEHACLYCEEIGVLLSGDQIIASITSNVSVTPMEPEANPLADWIRTLKEFLVLPEDTLVLPSHNRPFYGLHERIQQLVSHHEDHMLALEQACVTAKTLPELLPVIFKRTLDDNQLGMAQGECIAHLHLLKQRGLLQRELREDGLYWYKTHDADLPGKTLPESYRGDDAPQMV